MKKIVPSIAGIIVFYAMMRLWGWQENLSCLDVKFYYSGAQAIDFFNALSAETWQSYLRNEFFDLGFIVSYGSLFFFLLQRLFKNTKVLTRVLFFALGCDLIETLLIILVLTKVLDTPPSWLGIFTCLKWIAVTIVMIAIIIKTLILRKHTKISR